MFQFLFDLLFGWLDVADWSARPEKPRPWGQIILAILVWGVIVALAWWGISALIRRVF